MLFDKTENEKFTFVYREAFFCNTNSYINTSGRRLQKKSTSLSFNSL